MPMSESPLAWDDIKALLDRAMDSPKGLEVKFDAPGKAIQFRHRINQFKKIDRRENEKIYHSVPTHQLYKRTIYDKLVVLVEDCSVIIKMRSALVYDVMEIQ